jgi:ABC-2 type transport system ATP-binding protein
MADTGTPSGDPVLEVRNLVRHYGTTTAVDGVTFSVYSGEIFGLLGPNGAGKTTSLEIAEGLRQADAGEVRLFGQTGVDRGVRARIGVQLQSAALYPHLTVVEVLRLFAAFYAEPASPDDLIGLVDLADKRNAPTRTLSGGQQQRLSLALALVGRPELLFLDEPSVGMDPAARRRLWELVASLREAGTAIVLTTHYMDEAEVLCDRLGVMDRGRIIATGTVDEMVASHFPYQHVQFDRLPGVDDVDLARLPAVAGVVFENGHVRLQSTDVIQTMRSLLDLASAAGQPPTSLSVRRPTLETLFLDLTGRALTGDHTLTRQKGDIA